MRLTKIPNKNLYSVLRPRTKPIERHLRNKRPKNKLTSRLCTFKKRKLSKRPKQTSNRSSWPSTKLKRRLFLLFNHRIKMTSMPNWRSKKRLSKWNKIKLKPSLRWRRNSLRKRKKMSRRSCKKSMRRKRMLSRSIKRRAKMLLIRLNRSFKK